MNQPESTMTTSLPEIPAGWTITNIRRGVCPGTEHILYAQLRGSENQIIISARLAYIVLQLNDEEFINMVVRPTN
jgi:hypothetical protein